MKYLGRIRHYFLGGIPTVGDISPIPSANYLDDSCQNRPFIFLNFNMQLPQQWTVYSKINNLITIFCHNNGKYIKYGNALIYACKVLVRFQLMRNVAFLLQPLIPHYKLLQ